MGKNEIPPAKVPGKKPACQTQNHKSTLTRREGRACAAYLTAFGFAKNGAEWIRPADTSLPPESEVIDRDGLPVAIVKGKELVGYSLITYLMFKSSTKGLCHVQIGALVMEGIHDITLFSELKHYKVNDPKSRAFAMVEPVKAACEVYRAVRKESRPPPESDGDAVSAALTADSVGGLSFSKRDTVPDVKEGTDVEQRLAIEHDSATIDSATHALLAAFNEDLPEESAFLEAGRRKVLDQFCFKVQFGRLLRRKKKELNSTAAYTKWWKDHRPSADWDDQEISKCARYGAFEELIKNIRGIKLQDVDVRNCRKKAMLKIGAYKRKNVAALGQELVAKLDSGEVITEAIAKDLVERYKAKTAKAEPEPQASPKTLEDLVALLQKKKWLSSTGKKHKDHLSKLLKSLGRLDDLKGLEAEIVAELAAVFTVFK